MAKKPSTLSAKLGAALVAPGKGRSWFERLPKDSQTDLLNMRNDWYGKCSARDAFNVANESGEIKTSYSSFSNWWRTKPPED